MTTIDIDGLINLVGFAMTVDQIQVARIIKGHLVHELTALGYYCPSNFPSHVFTVYQKEDGSTYIAHIFIDPIALVVRQIDGATNIKTGKIDTADPHCFQKVIDIIQSINSPLGTPQHDIL